MTGQALSHSLKEHNWTAQGMAALCDAGAQKQTLPLQPLFSLWLQHREGLGRCCHETRLLTIYPQTEDQVCGTFELAEGVEALSMATPEGPSQM